MTDMKGLEKLRTAFIEVLGIEPGCECDELAYGVTPGWDSVAHLALVAAIEEAFEIMLPTDDVIEMSSFSKAKAIVAKNGAFLDA